MRNFKVGLGMKNFKTGCIISLVVILSEIAMCNSTYHFPDVSLQGTAAPELTQLSTLFVYYWTSGEQERHPGTVRTLEYCYHRRDPTQVQLEPVFTLILLKPDVGGYRVTHNIKVPPAQESQSCSNRGGIYTCCEEQLLSELTQQTSPLKIPSENTAFGIYLSSTGEDAILGYRPGQERTTAGYQIPVNDISSQLQVGGLIPLQNYMLFTEAQYRMFNFVIDSTDVITSTQRNRTDEEVEAVSSTTSTYTERYEKTPVFSTVTPQLVTQPEVISANITVLVIVLVVCLTTLLSLAIVAFVIYICCKAKRLRRKKESQRENGCKVQIPDETCQPHIYEYIAASTTDTICAGGHLPHTFTRNPSYACRKLQDLRQPSMYMHI